MEIENEFKKGELDFSELTLGSSIFVRADFIVAQNITNN